MKNRKMKIAAIFSLLCLCAMIMGNFIYKNSQPTNVYFRKNFGQVLLTPDNQYSLSLTFIIENLNNSTPLIYKTEDVISLSIDGLEILNYEIGQIESYKNYSLYFLKFTFKADRPVEINSIKLLSDNEYIYDIGSIYINAMQNFQNYTTPAVEVKSHTAEQLGEEMTGYGFSLEAKTDLVLEFDFGHFAEYVAYIEVQKEGANANNTEIIDTASYNIAPGVYEFNIKFDGYNTNYDVLYFYPKVTYNLDNTQYELWLGSGIYLNYMNPKQIPIWVENTKAKTLPTAKIN